MPRVQPYKIIEDYDFDPATSVTMLLIGFVAAIVVLVLTWAYFQPQSTNQTSARPVAMIDQIISPTVLPHPRGYTSAPKPLK
jgi:hypothetical protein